MKKLRWLKEWKKRKIGDISNASEKSAENFVSQGYAEYVKEKTSERTIPSSAKELLEKDYNNFEVNELVSSWAEDWNNATLKIDIIESMKNVAKKSKFTLGDLKELVKTYINDKIVGEEIFRREQEFIEENKSTGERLDEAQAKYWRDKFVMESRGDPNLLLSKNKILALTIAKVSPENYQTIIAEHNKPKQQEQKLNKEQKKEIAIKKTEEKEREAKDEGFLFASFNMFTNYLDIAKRFWEKQPFYYDEYKIFWLWNYEQKKWKKVDETTLINAIDDNTQSPTTDSGVKFEILEAMRRIGRRKKPLEPEKTWIQFKDNIYDFKTGVIIKATPKYFITNPIPWNIGTSEETPTMDKIFREWVVKEGIQDESYIKTLYEIMAYCMLSYMPIHRIFCFIGEGSNGKGSFLRLVSKLIGEENTCATELEVLTSIRFESSKLYKKLVCFIGEVDKGIFKKTKTLKSLTGEDMVRTEFKGKDGFDTKNYANPLIATNHLPETSDRTRGFYRRWTIVDFPNCFGESKDIVLDIPEEEYGNFCKKACRILPELIAKGEFTNDGSIEQREDKYERHSNFINEFVKLYCNLGEDKWVEFADFCEKYNEYLIGESLPPKSKVEIGRVITLKGYVKKVKKVYTTLSYNPETTKVCIFGIGWKEDSGLTV